jgi:hypothetical protein
MRAGACRFEATVLVCCCRATAGQDGSVKRPQILTSKPRCFIAAAPGELSSADVSIRIEIAHMFASAPDGSDHPVRARPAGLLQRRELERAGQDQHLGAITQSCSRSHGLAETSACRAASPPKAIAPNADHGIR